MLSFRVHTVRQSTTLKFSALNLLSFRARGGVRSMAGRDEAQGRKAKSELQAHILKSNFTLKKLSLIAEQSKKCE
ncbi:hypothetical protein OFO03_07105 [Campylobacter sp. JMF_02 ED1]|uniref:hypothetical protein n=1 Tax=unclassified Campylobacter TaxID=2593542 RepID=UPI0022E9F066|nr:MULTISPECIES: hypothetical protein [unclassified Campylobacter]MDA3050235.1 hypothetical protein [Campylobacter sp. JMF_15 NE4]MDA3051666.1 hypothetical protein [Campylobacter sp. JMF_02 ED1]